MVILGLWFGCAGPQRVTKQSTPLEENPILETIDLSKEFGLEFTGWYYHLSLHQNQDGTELHLPNNSGWAAISLTDQTLLGTGFYPASDPTEVCSSGCQVVNAHLSQSEPLLLVPTQVEQNLTDTAPQKSSGLVMIETWTEPLQGLPVQNKALRLRAVKLEPKGNVGQHKHQGRPSFAYILSGNLIEHRGDGDGPYKSGERVAERNGLVHWWENGDSVATIVVFDVIDAE